MPPVIPKPTNIWNPKKEYLIPNLKAKPKPKPMPPVIPKPTPKPKPKPRPVPNIRPPNGAPPANGKMKPLPIPMRIPERLAPVNPPNPFGPVTSPSYRKKNKLTGLSGLKRSSTSTTTSHPEGHHDPRSASRDDLNGSGLGASTSTTTSSRTSGAYRFEDPRFMHRWG